MDNLELIVGNLGREHPEILEAIKRVLASPNPADIETMFTFALQQFDARGQLQWQFADLLAPQPREAVAGIDRYWGLKYSATEMVQRIVANAGLPPRPLPKE